MRALLLLLLLARGWAQDPALETEPPKLRQDSAVRSFKPAAPQPPRAVLPAPGLDKPPSPAPTPLPPAWKGKPLPISWKDALKAVGRQATVEGKIEAAILQPKRLLLHFDKDHPDHLMAIVPRRALRNFPLEPEKYYLNKKVLVNGLVTRQGRRAVMILNHRSQIWLVGEALPKPPVSSPAQDKSHP